MRVVFFRYYFVIWVAILTSPPHGPDLDMWLFLICALDLVPFAISVIRVALAAAIAPTSTSSSELMVLEVASTMGAWSPAFQLNTLLLCWLDGDIFAHAQLVFAAAACVGEARVAAVRWIYC